MAVFQGDFGRGVPSGNGPLSHPGANPCVLDGPVTTAGVQDQGVFYPKFRVGQELEGDFGSEFIYAKLVLASATDLIPGQAYWLDEHYTATLMSGTNANNLLNSEVVILSVFAVQQGAGTYYGWFQREGRCSVMAATGSTANGQGETTATAGTLKFVANGSHTASQKSVAPTVAFTASSGVTFTGNTTNGSPYITAVASALGSGGVTDLQLGQTITGTGLPANSCIASIDKNGGVWRIGIGTATAGNYNVLQNATANGAAVTFTVTSHVTANLQLPTLSAQN